MIRAKNEYPIFNPTNCGPIIAFGMINEYDIDIYGCLILDDFIVINDQMQNKNDNKFIIISYCPIVQCYTIRWDY